MTYETFLAEISEMLGRQLGDQAQVSLHTIRKNNNVKKMALCILEQGSNVSPTIYMEPFYERLKSGIPPIQICREILEFYRQNHCSQYMEIQALRSFEKMKERIVYKLIHYEQNAELLRETPHRRYLDLAVVYYLLIEDPFIGSGTAVIHHRQRQLWQVEEEDLYQAAVYNTDRLLGNQIQPIEQVLLELLEQDIRHQLEDDIKDEICTDKQVSQWAGDLLRYMLPEDRHDMYIISNDNKYLGAAALLNERKLETFAERIGGGFFVIPSSIHEAILLPQDTGTCGNDVQELLREINRTENNEVDFLSDRLYFYTPGKGLHYGVDD